MDVLSKIDSHFKNQTELGLAVGVSQSVVSEWLTGKAKFHHLEQKRLLNSLAYRAKKSSLKFSDK